MKRLYHNAIIVNEGREYPGYVITDGDIIVEVGEGSAPLSGPGCEAIDCRGGLLMPGAIDTHVHFREPGLTEKADIASESRAALAGGVTSYIDMPNTKPPTVTVDALDDKMSRAAANSAVNYAFFIGATDSNLDELLAADYRRTAGIKLFLGSSTGGMLVTDEDALHRLFASAPAIIAVHAEDERIIAAARDRLKAEHPEGIPLAMHPDVRPREACVAATRHAIALAEQTGARLHVCHISTADELRIIADAKARGVRVTAETCPQYLLFDRTDLNTLGARVKCNPAIKEASDRIALIRELRPGGVIDTIATDHAPHGLGHAHGAVLAPRHARSGLDRPRCRGLCHPRPGGRADGPRPGKDIRHRAPRLHPSRLLCRPRAGRTAPPARPQGQRRRRRQPLRLDPPRRTGARLESHHSPAHRNAAPIQCLT